MPHKRFLFRSNLSGHWFTNRSTTTSLGSSIYDSVEENGRTYHRFKEGSESSRPSWDRADSLIELECVLPNNQVSQQNSPFCPPSWLKLQMSADFARLCILAVQGGAVCMRDRSRFSHVCFCHHDHVCEHEIPQGGGNIRAKDNSHKV
jgi:hypothetical protein